MPSVTLDDYQKQIKAIKTSVLPTTKYDRGDVEVLVSDRGGYLLRTQESKMVVHRLVELGYLDSHHPEYAMTFLTLREVWLSPVSAKVSGLSDAIKSFFDGSSVRPAELYDTICRRLFKPTAPIIVWTASTLSTHPKASINAAMGKVCFDAYSDLEKAMDEVNDAARKLLRKAN